jgi:hypothetical protein
MPGARAFAGSMADAPLHTDSQRALGFPAQLLVMACIQPAAAGGDTVLVDTRDALQRVQQEDPPFFRALTHAHRPHRFYFGAWEGPTLARRGNHAWFTHAPAPAPNDALGQRVLDWVQALPRTQVHLRSQQAIIVDNHRMLHGRTAFADPQRHLLRLLCWPLTRWGDAPAWLDAVPQLPPTMTPPPSRHVPQHAVERMLAGHPPAALCRELGLEEPTLYASRDALLGSSHALSLPHAARFCAAYRQAPPPP